MLIPVHLAILPSTQLIQPRRAYLAGWVLEDGVGAGSVKTCSVRGPGWTVVASDSLGPESGTSVASVASSVDWDGLTFPLAVAATSPVERGVSLANGGRGMWGWGEEDLGLTLSLVQYWGVSSGGTVATWYIAAGGTPH